MGRIGQNEKGFGGGTEALVLASVSEALALSVAGSLMMTHVAGMVDFSAGATLDEPSAAVLGGDT